MPEPTTRDEHRAEAERMAVIARENYVEARSGREREGAVVASLLALTHAVLSLPLGQLPATDESPRWTATRWGGHTRVVGDTVWTLRWEPSIKTGFLWRGDCASDPDEFDAVDLAAAQRIADRRIDTWLVTEEPPF